MAQSKRRADPSNASKPSKLARRPEARTPRMGGVDVERLEALLERQREHCPKILAELELNRRKVSCWAWWVFPTEMPGASEPPPATAVSAVTAFALLRRAPPSWRGCLEKVSALAEEQASGGRPTLRNVLPPIDHGRVDYFVKFWRGIKNRPVWLDLVLDTLGAAAGTPPLELARAPTAAAPLQKAPKSQPTRLSEAIASAFSGVPGGRRLTSDEKRRAADACFGAVANAAFEDERCRVAFRAAFSAAAPAASSAEELQAAAWASVQAARAKGARRLRRRAAAALAVDEPRAAGVLLRRAVKLCPADAAAHLAHAERLRDGGELKLFERSLRLAVAAAALAPSLVTGPGDRPSVAARHAGWHALQKLGLLLCQEGRAREAQPVLAALGQHFRLSKGCLHYDIPAREEPVPNGAGLSVVDGALPADLFRGIVEAFGPKAPFWREHRYHDPGTGYFSYIMPVGSASSSSSSSSSSSVGTLMGAVVEAVRLHAVVLEPRCAAATVAEWWAHCRVHASGHQLHFDSVRIQTQARIIRISKLRRAEVALACRYYLKLRFLVA